MPEVKANTTGTWTIAAAAAVIVVLFLLSRSAAVEAVYPIERGATSLARGVWRRAAGAWRGAAAVAECSRLRRELDALAVVRNDIDRLSAENARLRRDLGFAARGRGEWLAAEVLSKGGGAAGRGHAIRLDRGSLAGVSVGAAVVVPDGLVGLVTAVTPHTSEATLITDSRVRVDCEIETSAARRPCGLLSGGGDDMLVVVPRRESSLDGAANVAERARVVASGKGGVFPAGLVIGDLVSARTDGEGRVESVKVMPSVDFQQLESVFIRREE